MTLRLLIADDEPLARQRLRSLIEELGHEVCAEAADAPGAEAALRRTRPDAALLDIEMPGQDGLTLARVIKKEFPQVPVVMVTAHSEHAVEAFEVAVRDYLLKPVRRERLARALERVSAAQAPETAPAPVLRVKTGRKERLVPLDEIDCFVAEQGYVMARSAHLEGFVEACLHELETQLGEAVIRVHRSCVAVRSAIAGIETRSASDHRLLFRDGMEPVSISRRHLSGARGTLRKPALDRQER
jgi:two-component system response regulator AlgR